MSAHRFDIPRHDHNRQYNRQNPAFASRAVDYAHYDHTSRWPEAVRWHKGYPDENARPRLPYEESADGVAHDPFAPKLDHALTPALLLAALSNDADGIRDLLARGAGTECRTESGATPLICAASKGASDAVLALLDAGANVVAQDKVGATCLTLAAFRGHVAVARLVLDHPSTIASEGATEALLFRRTLNGETPLMAAAKAGRCEMIDELIFRVRGDRFPLKPYDDGAGYDRRITALQLACRAGELDAVKRLVAGGADIAERSGARKMNPLMHAARTGRAEIVAFLLNPSASLPPSFAQSDEGEHRGADPTATDSEGVSALLHAAMSGERSGAAACFERIAEAWPGGPEAALEARDRSGRNALMLAARYGGTEMTRVMLEKTGAVAAGAFDGNKESALFAAVKGGFVEPNGAADLVYAAYPVHEHELEMIEVKNNDGLTPLLWAARHGRTAAARWCVGKGADMLATDAKGRIARQTAEAHGHGECAQMLSELARERWMRKM